MFHKSNPRWTRLLFGMVWMVATTAAAPAFAGTTHTEGGAVSEAPGVPETDGTATVQVYWTGDSAARTSVTTGATLAGYWLHDAGFELARQWLVGDEHAAVLEMQTGAGTAGHIGYYGVTTKNLTSLDPDEFPAMTVRPIPVPLATAGPGSIALAWNQARNAGPNTIAGYNVFRSTNGIAFTKLNASILPDTTYLDATTVFGTTYQYAIALVYRGTPSLESTVLSGNSASVTPLDATPPDAPEIVAEPGFTPGAANTISWSSEAESGATAYFVECALDAAFTSLVGNSGWIAATNHQFTGLADGRIYHYRVRARDAATNMSGFSAGTASRQDASAPASQMLALGAYKASSTLSLDWAGTDSLSGLASVQLHWSRNGAAFELYPGGPFTTTPISFDASTTGGDGAYAFYTIASDAVANTETAPETPDATTIVDTEAPAITAIAALPAFTPGATRNVTWSSAAETGAIEYRLQASSAADFSSLAFESGWLTELTATAEGLADATLYNYRVQSRDAAENESAWSELATSTQDASAPATAVAALPAYSSASSIDIAWSGSDAASGLAGVELYWTKDGGAETMLAGGPFTTSPIAFDVVAAGGDGLYTFSTRGTDAVGNMEAAAGTPDASITIDSAAPGAPTLAALPAHTVGTERMISWTGDAASWFAQASTTPDFSALAGESGWITGTEHTFTGLADATPHYYRVKGRDAAGNESAYSTALQSTQDATPPATTASALPAITTTTSFDIAWSGSDATSGLTGVDLWISKDGGTFTLYSGSPFAASPIAFDATAGGGDGAYRFYTRGHDAVGNLEQAPAEADAQTTIDTSAPGAPTITGLQNMTAGATIHLVWSDESASGAASYLAEMATDAAFTSIAANSGWIAGLEHDFTSLTDGQKYWFRVRARDAAQNETGFSGTQSTTMDATPPQAALAAMPATTNDPSFALAWDGSDATSGILNVDLYMSKNGAAYTLVAGSPFTASPIAFDATSMGDGLYAFYIRARDHAGNLEAAPGSPEAQTQLDTQAPGAPAIASLPAFTLGTSRMVGWNDESASGAAAYLVQAATDAGFTTIAFASDWMTGTSHTFNGLTDGATYWYRVRSRDALMNESAWGTVRSSTQDATAPASQIASLPATTASMHVMLAWSGSDATSGLQNIDLYFSKNGGAFTLAPGGPFTTSPIDFDASPAGGDGNYAFYIVARDAVGNLEAAPAAADASTLIDTEGPGSPTIAGLGNFSPGSSVNVSWNALDGGSAYRAQMSSLADFGLILQDSGWITATEATFSSLADGNAYYFRVQARDAAQNPGGFSPVASTTMDAGAPSSALDAIAALHNTSMLSLHWNGFDTVSGIAGIDLYYSRNGSAFTLYPGGPWSSNPIEFDASTTGGDGNYALYARARDAAGNIESPPGSPDATTRIDTAAPNAPAITALPEFTAGATVSLTWTNQSASGAMEYRAQMSTDPNFGTIASASPWIAGTSWSFTSLDEDVTYFFRAQSRDAAQNESPASPSQTTTLDDTAPASMVSEMPAVTATLAFNVAWTGSDATSGIMNVDLFYARNGGAYTLYPGGPYTASPIAFDAATTGGQGSYAFYTRARDRVANRETSPAGPDASTVVNTAATGAPTLAALPAFTAGTSRTITWAAGANNSTYLAQAATDAGFGSIAAQSDWSTETDHVFGGLLNGQTYWYRVKSRSASEIEGPWSEVRSSTQDATAPVSAASALAATMTTTAFDIAWNGSDATSNVTGVRLYVSRNGAAYAELAGGPFTTSPIAFDATSMGGDGDYRFYTRAIDAAGNFEAAPGSPDATTTIDTAAPSAPTMLAEPSATQGTSNTVAWNASTGAAEYEVQAGLDAAFANLFATSGWITPTNYTFTGLSTGTNYWYRSRARDAAGNAGDWSAAVMSMQSEGYILQAGWNLVSFNVAPSDTRIDQVLASIAGSYNIVRTYHQGGFRTYLPSLPIGMNDLQDMDALHGYWIYMTQTATLTVGGMPMNAGTPIALGTGWNLAGFLPATPMSPGGALATIAGSYSLARSYEPGVGYHTYYPSLPALSDLTEMRSGQGYWLYMTSPDELVYGGLPKVAEANESPLRGLDLDATSAAAAVPTVMDLYSTEFTIDGELAPAGTVVEAIDAQGRVMGSATVTADGSLSILHLHGDVSITATDEGALPGESFTLRVKDRDLTQLGDASFRWEADAARATKLEFVATESLLPRAFALAQNIPNPFNPSTRIEYAIPGRAADGRSIAATQVDLRVFDARGRVVKTLIATRQAPGRYSVVWNGRDEQGMASPSGVYFVRFKTDEFTQSRKMLMIK